MSAFEGLVRRYQPRLLAFLERSLGNRQDAEDVTQRVFVTIHQTVDRFRADHSFPTWMFMIARRQAVDFHRRTGTREQTIRRVQSLAESDDGLEEDPVKILAKRERHEEIWHWVRRQLREQAFTALWLQVQEDMDDREIARVMKLTRTHVRVILHRARKKLVQARRRAARTSGSPAGTGDRNPSANPP